MPLSVFSSILLKEDDAGKPGPVPPPPAISRGRRAPFAFSRCRLIMVLMPFSRLQVCSAGGGPRTRMNLLPANARTLAGAEREDRSFDCDIEFRPEAFLFTAKTAPNRSKKKVRLKRSSRSAIGDFAILVLSEAYQMEQSFEDVEGMRGYTDTASERMLKKLSLVCDNVLMAYLKNRHLLVWFLMEFAIVIQALAWLTFGLLMLATVVPIGARSLFMTTMNIQSIFLFGLMGLLFVVAYPDSRRIVGLFCILAAAVSESLLLIFPDRHLRVERMLIKVLGATVGLLVGGLLMQVMH